MRAIGDLAFPPNQYDAVPGVKPCALYVVLSKPFVKFGVASDPVARLIDLRAANPHPLRMVAAWWLPRAVVKRAEAYCHQHFMADWHRNEWFSTEAKEARRVAKLIATAAAASRNRPLQAVSLPLAADLERALRLRRNGPTSLQLLAARHAVATPALEGREGSVLSEL